MKLRLPSLTALRAFESAARFENFTRAAEELSVTHGAVSRQIAALENELGVPLFERRHGTIRLTPRGLQLRDEVTASFLRLGEATERVRHRSPADRPLRMSAPPAFSVRWLIPRLSMFQHRHPSIDVSLASSVAPPDFSNDDYDLAIRRFDRMPPCGHAVALFDEVSIPVCHVDLLQRLPRPLDFARLVRSARLMRVAAEPRGWDKWARHWHADLSRARFVDVELTYLAMQAALEGLGVALLPLALASDDIARGVLAAPLGPLQLDGSTYFVVSAGKPAARSAAARCIEWLRLEASDSMRVAHAAMGT
jgi:LysR family glycine cleavage system transcriptional activator